MCGGGGATTGDRRLGLGQQQHDSAGVRFRSLPGSPVRRAGSEITRAAGRIAMHSVCGFRPVSGQFQPCHPATPQHLVRVTAVWPLSEDLHRPAAPCVSPEQLLVETRLPRPVRPCRPPNMSSPCRAAWTGRRVCSRLGMTAHTITPDVVGVEAMGHRRRTVGGRSAARRSTPRFARLGLGPAWTAVPPACRSPDQAIAMENPRLDLRCLRGGLRMVLPYRGPPPAQEAGRSPAVPETWFTGRAISDSQSSLGL